MPIGALIGAGAGLIGSSLLAKSQRDAASTASKGQVRAAEIAAEAAAFRPVGVTTRFGTSRFDYDSGGKLTGAGYTVDPRLAAYQDRLMNLADTGLAQAEQAPAMYEPLRGAASGLFDLGSQYLAQSPEQAAQDYMNRQLELLAPSRERQLAQLQNRLFQTGRTGLAVGATGARPSGAPGLAAASPEMEAYYNALAQQDAALAAQAMEEGRAATAFGAGLFGTGANLLGGYQAGQVGALSPFSGYLQGVQGIEGMGQQPFDISTALGARAATSGAMQGNLLFQGLSNAANTQLAAAPFSTQAVFGSALQGLGQNRQFTDWASGLFRPSPAGSYTTTDFIP